MNGDKKTPDVATTWLLAGAFAVFAVAWRLGPYVLNLDGNARWVWNFTPVGALGLFIGARLRSPWALMLPVATMAVADLLLVKPLADRGFASISWMTPLIYGSFTLYALLGRLLPRDASPVWLVPLCVLGSAQFFVVTNFGVWVGSDGVLYPKTLAGLFDCYLAALPFVGKDGTFALNTVGGDLGFTGVFFGIQGLASLASRREKASQPA
jgi:hypothetical protein